MLGLPVELQEQVLDYLSRQDLLSLAQTCKSLSIGASARLRKIIPRLDPWVFTRCACVLAENPIRAAEVLEFNVARHTATIQPRPAPRRAPSLCSFDFFQAFKNLTRLRKLVIYA